MLRQSFPQHRGGVDPRASSQSMGTSRAPHGGPSARIPKRGNLTLDLPIAWRLTLGFAMAGLLAALAAGIVGAQRSAALSQQSAFYQNLLQINTNLSTAASMLQLMDTKTHEILDNAASSAPSTETLASDERDVPRLAVLYERILSDYAANDLLQNQPEKRAILDEAEDSTASARQVASLSSAQRTWNAYQTTVAAVLQSVASGDVVGAQSLERLAGEPTNADAQSALRTLLQFNGSLAKDVRRAAEAEEQNLLLLSAGAALAAFAGVALIGWFISQTIVARLSLLRSVTRAVSKGRMDARAPAIGRDEIGDVTESVNGMLDTIVSLLDETRRQRDALTGAAERLFSDMRVASGGDLRVTARASSDPIGLLGNAFNLTIGRFKRLISRTSASTNQIAALARGHIDRADIFMGAVRSLTSHSGPSSPSNASRPSLRTSQARAWSGPLGPLSYPALDAGQPGVDAIQRLGLLINKLASTDAGARAQEALDVAQQAYLSRGRLTQLTQEVAKPQPGGSPARLTDAMIDELRLLERLLRELGRDVYAMRLTSDATIQEMREALTELAVAPQVGAAYELSEVATESQLFEFIHLASSFAQETTTLARQSLVVAEDMRVSVTPFQYDAPARPAIVVGMDAAGELIWGIEDGPGMGSSR